MSYLCPNCGFQSAYSFQECPNCRDPQEIIEETPVDAERHAVKLSEWEAEPMSGCMTGTPFDKISEEGMPHAASILISGPAGCGKSTWALRIASRWEGQPWYFPYERGIDALRRDVERLNLPADRIWVCSAVASPFKFYAAKGLLVIDSLNDYASRFSGLLDSVRTLSSHAWATGTTVLMIAHVNKEWDLAGPERLKHEVDVHVEIFPMGKKKQLIRCQQKNRFGPLWETTSLTPWSL